jgi:hypothetical protein
MADLLIGLFEVLFGVGQVVVTGRDAPSVVPKVHEALSEVLASCQQSGIEVSGILDGTRVVVTPRENGWAVVIDTPPLPLRLVAHARGALDKRAAAIHAPECMAVELLVDQLEPWLKDPVVSVVVSDRKIALLCHKSRHKALPDVVLLAGRLVAAARAMVAQATSELPADVRGDVYRGEIDERPRREQAQQWAKAITAFEEHKAYKRALYDVGG